MNKFHDPPPPSQNNPGNLHMNVLCRDMEIYEEIDHMEVHEGFNKKYPDAVRLTDIIISSNNFPGTNKILAQN